VYLFILRRWAHNATYTDVANLHNRIDDIPSTLGTPVIVDGVVDVYWDIMIEARCDGRNCGAMCALYFMSFVYGL
jgi:hypothetical protein